MLPHFVLQTHEPANCKDSIGELLSDRLCFDLFRQPDRPQPQPIAARLIAFDDGQTGAIQVRV